jgi:DeoR/GlpR family transcriptional regulator of sugar metabolism
MRLHQERKRAIIRWLNEHQPLERDEIMGRLMNEFGVSIYTASNDIESLQLQSHVEEREGHIYLVE